VLFLLVYVVALLDLNLVYDNLVFLLVLLCQLLLSFLLQQLNLRFSIELIYLYPSNLVEYPLELHLFLSNIETDLSALFDKIGSCFLYCSVFTLLIY